MKHKQSFITGALILGISGVIAKFLGLFFRWPVTMLIGDEGIGLYQLSYPIYMFIIGIMSGFPIAISKMVSQRVAVGKKVQAHRVFKYSFYILILIGLASSLSIYLSAPYLIKALRWREEAYYSMVAMSAAPVFVAVMSSYRGYFQGLQMMTIPAASQIVEQIGRVIVGVGLTYTFLPFGISYSAAGASFGACAGAVIGCMLLVGGYIKYRRITVPYRIGGDSEGGWSIISELIRTAVPISIGTAVNSIMALMDSVIVPSQLLSAGFGEKMATELYGQLTGKAHVLINVPLTFSMALATSLVPAMSEVSALKCIRRIKTRAESAVKASILLGLPSAAGLFVLADPVLNLIFPGISEGVEVLQILSVSVIFTVVGQTFVSILHGLGDVKSPVRNLAAGSVFKLILVYTLTAMPALNIKGAAISSIVGNLVAAILNYRDAVRRAYISFDIDKMLLRPILSTMAMGMGVYESYKYFLSFTGSNGTSTIISIITGIIIYVLMIFLTGCVTLKEVFKYIKLKKSH